MKILDTSSIKMKDPRYDRYRLIEEREKTFRNWPLAFIQPEDLARNGFIYTGKKDSVFCVYCSLNIEQWETDDTPNIEHRKHSPRCSLIRILNDEESLSGSKV